MSRITNPNSQKDSPNTERASFFQNTILKWFKKNGRNYPWRKENSPYRILVAESMLQRTKVAQVLPVYSEFIKKFPTAHTLADAKVDEISVFVNRLGLMWRSRRMSEMAKYLVSEFDGKIPVDRKQLLSIPGIGDYIADAMISFAFGGRRIIIDSNVVRLISRMFGFEIKGEMRRNRQFVDFCQNLSQNIKSEDIRKFNYGLIDHAAAICKPDPLCVKCPLAKKCQYFNQRK
ncbi:MAG: hypothetical protein QXY90_06160 [Candidatus Anstonellales archaeon]